MPAQKEQDTFYLQLMIVFLFVFAERILNLSSAGVSPALTDSHLDASSRAYYIHHLGRVVGDTGLRPVAFLTFTAYTPKVYQAGPDIQDCART